MLTKTLARVFSFSQMAHPTSFETAVATSPDEVAERRGLGHEAPPSVEEAKKLGLEVEREYGLNLKSEDQPSGPTSPHVRVKRRAGRFARFAVDATDGKQPDSALLQR
jgi:hypothetical protein